jgi:hypothetical protein
MGRINKPRNKEVLVDKSADTVLSDVKNNKTKKLMGKVDLKPINKKKQNKSAISNKVSLKIFINFIIDLI